MEKKTGIDEKLDALLKELKDLKTDVLNIRNDVQVMKTSIQFIHTIYTTPAKKSTGRLKQTDEEILAHMNLTFHQRRRKKVPPIDPISM